MALSKFGKIVERMQAKRGLSDERLAAEAGVSRQNLYRMKRAQRPHLTTIYAVAKALEADVKIFLSVRD